MNDQFTADTSPLEFPCEITVRAMGRASPELHGTVFRIVANHVPGLVEESVRLRSSSKGNYISVQVTFLADNRHQMERIYGDLHACDLILMTL